MANRPYVVNEVDCPVEGWENPERGAVWWRTLISGDRSPTEALTMGVADVAERAPRLHRHAQAEAYYVLSGEGVLRINGVDRPLSAGSAAFIPGGAPHAAWTIGHEPLRLVYVFAADAFEDVVYEFDES